MKKLLAAAFALTILAFAGPTLIAEEGKDCSSPCTKAGLVKTVAEDGSESVTITGELVRCQKTLASVAEENGMCPTSTPASGKHTLVKTADGTVYMISSPKAKLGLCETIKQVRATGKLVGSNLTLTALEIFSEGEWKPYKLEDSTL